MGNNGDTATRPLLNRKLSSKMFQSFYYLKDELVQFCRDNGLPVSGGKDVLTRRIALFLETGEVAQKDTPAKSRLVARDVTMPIDLQTIIENNFICSEAHRAFFKKHIGNTFSFNVLFQNWLKENSGRTYQEAIEAYNRIQKERKGVKTPIDKQFEYNAYIRDFFADNKGRSLDDAIKCWKYKKSVIGHNRYEKTDLVAIAKK